MRQARSVPEEVLGMLIGAMCCLYILGGLNGHYPRVDAMQSCRHLLMPDDGCLKRTLHCREVAEGT